MPVCVHSVTNKTKILQYHNTYSKFAFDNDNTNTENHGCVCITVHAIVHHWPEMLCMCGHKTKMHRKRFDRRITLVQGWATFNKNVILTTWGPDCNRALPPVGHCISIIQLANLTQRQNIDIPEWYTIISVQWRLKNHHSIKITQAQSATVITKTNIHVWCAFLLSALPFHDMFHIYAVKEQWEILRTEKNIFCYHKNYILKMIFPWVKHNFICGNRNIHTVLNKCICVFAFMHFKGH